MNIVNMAKWVEALESGDYIQTTGVLREDYPDNSSCFCAAGVLVDIAIQDGIDMAWDAGVQTYRFQWLSDSGALIPFSTSKVITPAVKTWLGYDIEPMVDLDRHIGVIEANDDYGMTFLQIARGLRHNYLES